MRRRKPTSIGVIGRRWFQRSYGNTYFSAAIYVDGEAVHYIDYEYGYGNQYLQAATEWLYDNGYLPGLKQYSYGGMEPLWQYCDRKGIKCSYEAIDVARKKDL